MNVELAKRAVACKGWRWMPGMRFTLDFPGYGGSDRVLSNNGYDIESIFRETQGKPSLWLPDFADPATRGCLLELVRDLRHDPALHVHPYGHGWRWRSNYRDCSAIYDSEAEALVAALEACNV